jgi:hypothetical protein
MHLHDFFTVSLWSISSQTHRLRKLLTYSDTSDIINKKIYISNYNRFRYSFTIFISLVKSKIVCEKGLS